MGPTLFLMVASLAKLIQKQDCYKEFYDYFIHSSHTANTPNVP